MTKKIIFSKVIAGSAKTLFGGVMIFLLSASIARADVTGMWDSEKPDVGGWITVEIYQCGTDTYCGKIAELHKGEVPDPDVEPPEIDLEMITGMTKKSENKFAGGRIYAPDTKKWYKSKMTLIDDNTLEVAGCILGGLICRSQMWSRSP